MTPERAKARQDASDATTLYIWRRQEIKKERFPHLKSTLPHKALDSTPELVVLLEESKRLSEIFRQTR